MYSSHFSGSVHWQSANFPGMPRPSRSPLRLRERSRAFRAAIRAAAASIHLRTTSFPSLGFRSNHSPSSSFTVFCTNDLASVLPNFVFVWPSNCGSPILMETIAVRPSRTSSPVSRSSFFRINPHSSPNLFTKDVSAVLKPSSWVPPSCVLIVFAKV